MLVLMDQMHSVDERRLDGRGLGGEWRPSRQEAGHRDAGRRTLSKLASSMTYVTICQPPWRYTGTTRGMWSPTAAGILADRASLGEDGMIRSSKVHHAHATDMLLPGPSPPWRRSGSSTALVRHHRAWQPGQAETAAAGGADRRSAKNAAAPMNQSREAHRLAPPAPSRAAMPRSRCSPRTPRCSPWSTRSTSWPLPLAITSRPWERS
jgi:hypothetical protein